MAKITLSPVKAPRVKLRGFKAWKRNEKGVSAVEFALIAPLLIALYLGCVELSLMLRADRAITSTSSAVGDLTARLSVVTDDDLQDIFAGVQLMMTNVDMSKAKIRLTSISDDGNGSTTVDWSEGYQITALTEGSPVTVPSGIISSGGSVIMSEVEYTYESKIALFFDTDMQIKDKFYLRPRRVNQITRQSDSGGTSSFGPAS